MKKVFALVLLAFSWTILAWASEPLAYVATQSGFPSFSSLLTVINWKTGTVVGTIPVQFGPVAPVPSPDGKRLYIIETAYPPTLAVVCTITNRVIQRTIMPVPVSAYGSAWGMALTPDGGNAYVVNSQNSSSLDVWDTGTLKHIATVPLTRPSAVKLSPDGTVAYVADFGVIDFISTATKEITAQAPGPYRDGNLAVTPDGRRLYADGDYNRLDVISTASTQIVDVIPLAGAFTIAMSPDGKFAYVMYNTGSTSDNAVAKIDTATNNVIESSPAVPTGVGRIAISPDGTFLYATTRRYAEPTDAVLVIDTASMDIVKTIPVISGAGDVAFLP